MIQGYSWCFQWCSQTLSEGELFSSNLSFQTHHPISDAIDTGSDLCQFTNTVGWIHTNKKKKNCNTCVPLDLLIFKILHVSSSCYIFHLGTRELFGFFLVKNRKCNVRDLCFQGKDSELFFTLVCLAFLFSFFQRQLFLDSGKLFLAFKKKKVWFLILILQ